jgi:hypothetical protein
VVDHSRKEEGVPSVLEGWGFKNVIRTAKTKAWRLDSMPHVRRSVRSVGTGDFRRNNNRRN